MPKITTHHGHLTDLYLGYNRLLDGMLFPVGKQWQQLVILWAQDNSPISISGELMPTPSAV